MKSVFAIAMLFAATSAVHLQTKDEFSKVVSTAGKGQKCKNGDNVNVNYTGTLMDGTKFDSNKDHGTDPFNFALGASRVIKCWDQGVAMMEIGEAATLTCPSDIAYGAKGAGDKIPGGATLKFDVELIDCGGNNSLSQEENDQAEDY